MLALSDILKSYPQVLVFNKDNYKNAPEGLLDFYQKTSMSGGSFDLTYLRSPTFFDFIFCHSSDFLVFVGINRKNEITGIASMIFRQGFINGHHTRVCYLADLRLSYDRETLRLWRPLMGELLLYSSEIQEISTDYFYTAVIDSNKKAQQALLHSKNNHFIYDELSTYKMINILRPLPWRKIVGKKFQIRRGKAEDTEKLSEFLNDSEIPFGEVASINFLKNRFKTWNNFSPENFYLCFEEEKLLGTFAPWAPSSKKNQVIRTPAYFNILKLLFNLPKANETLEILYLTHLRVSSPEVFKAMLSFFYDHHASLQDYHFISFCDFPSQNLSTSLRSQYISSGIPMKLFTVRHKNKPQFTLKPHSAYGFEMALV